MLTKIRLQIANVSGVQLRVINTLKKHGLVATRHAVKDTPDGVKLMEVEVEGDESMGEDAITAIAGGIEGVESVLKINRHSVHVETTENDAVPEENRELTEDEKRFKNKESEAGDIEIRDRMLVFSLLSRYPNISNRLIELKSTIPEEERLQRLYELGWGFGIHLVPNLKVKDPIPDLATALEKVVMRGLQPLANCELRGDTISITGYSKNLDRGKPDEQLCQFVRGTIEGLLRATEGLPEYRVEKKQCLYQGANCCDYQIVPA